MRLLNNMFHDFSLNRLVVMLVPLIFAVTLHEVAHGYVAYRLGDHTARQAGRLTLNPLKHLDFFGSLLLPLLLKFSGSPVIFGYAKPVPVNFANLRDVRKGTILVAAAGCTVNLVLAVLSGLSFQLLMRTAPHWYRSIVSPLVMDLFLMLGYSVLINAVLAIFNMIPIPPLDGGRILSMFLPPGLQRKFLRLERFGMLVIIFLLISNVLNKLISFFLVPLLHFSLGAEGVHFIFGR